MAPRICIAGYIVFAASIFWISDLIVLSSGCALAIALAILLPYRKLKTGFVPISIFLFITFITNVLFYPGRIMFDLGPFIITEEGIRIASIRTMRVLLLIYGAKFLTIVSPLDESLNALGELLRPLEKVGLPIRELFRTMSLSVKILPIVKSRIHEEYKSRIAEGERKGMKDKVFIVYKFLMPVFLRSISDPASFIDERVTPGMVVADDRLEDE
ncbi:MAG: hypothetical protein JSV21_09440 [Nitrospirota bacterium]|nr:MAG: hypothetical protein JSV21_09440 [Nitrospirota bacterium]